ncbi:MAG TPA: hypothetical protein DIW17_06490 [Clostridiales bacterium]|nr:hypothetical protein [Clostridiales bacterium]
MMNRIISIALALCLLLSMTACTGVSRDDRSEYTPTQEPSSSPNVSETEPADDTNGEEEDRYLKVFDPPIIYTTVLAPPAGDVLPEGQTIEDNLRSRMFTRQTGLKPKVIWSASGEAFTEKMNMTIASGDIPDYFQVNYQQFEALVKADLLADLTDAYNQIAHPDIKAIYESADNADIKAVSKGGRIYGIPKADGLGNMNPVLWVRKDWIDKLDAEEPKCIADIAKLAEAFMKGDPDGNNVDDTDGLLIMPNYDSANPGIGSVSDIFTNYGATPNQWRVQEDGKVIYGSLMPQAVEALELLNGWYEQGLIPKDFASWKEETYKQKVTSGQAGLLFGMWWLSWSYMTDTVINDPSAEWTAYALPKESEGNYIGGAPNPASSNIGVVSKEYKDPSVFIYALNNTYNAMQQPGYGAEMEEAAVVSNNYTPMTIFPLSANAIFDCSVLAYRYANGEITRDQVVELTPDLSQKEYNLMIADCAKVVADAESSYDHMDDWSNSMGYTIGMMAMYNANVEFVRSDYSGITPTMERRKTFLDKLELDAYTKMIMGDTGGKSIQEYFDEFVAQYLDQGGQDITNEVQEVVNALR